MQLPTEARHRVDAPLVADEARDVAIGPAHEQRALAGLGDNAVPGAAAFIAGIAHTLERNRLGGGDGEHDRIGACSLSFDDGVCSSGGTLGR